MRPGWLLTLLLAAWPAAAADHAVILQYHHVAAATPRSTSVTPDEFATHLDLLVDGGFHVAPLPDVAAALARGENLPDSTVCLTADDGYVSLMTEALPRLRERGWTMTVFVCTGDIDRGGSHYLTWDQLRTLAAAGWTIASHAHTHDHLVRRQEGESEDRWRARVRENIATSLRRLEEEIGTAPPLFAYPYGEFDPELATIVRDLGLVGFGQQSGAAWAGGDLGALPRFPVSGPYADADQLRTKLASLPLPVTRAEPRSPVLPDAPTTPVLELTIASGGWDPARMQAYVAGQGRVPHTWVDRDAGRVRIPTPEPLPRGRSRTNVTAPATAGGRWYWYSHPWLRPGAWD